MSRTFPRDLPLDVRSAPERDAECRVFDSLKSGLCGDYRVFYSVAWLNRRADNGAWDGEADFVVVHPRHGILVLEVKGGYIRRDGETGVWSTQARNGRSLHVIKDPVGQAKRSKFHLAGAIESLPRWVSGKAKLGHAVAFPHCEAQIAELSPDCPSEIVMYAPDLFRVDEWIETAYGFWSGHMGSCTSIDAAAMRDIENFLSPTVELRPAIIANASLLSGIETTIAELTTQQERVLRSLARNRRVAVGGGAGTGKTMLALTKAKHLASQGFRTLLTCYNRPLADYLKLAAGPREYLQVADFHQVCISAIRTAGIMLEEGSGREFWETVVPNAFVDALSREPSAPFDAIVVDEAQDFAESWWISVELAIADSDHSILYVFYDDNQRLYRRTASFPERMADYRLCENLRNTKQIYQATTKFYEGSELVCVGPSGNEVEYVLASDALSQGREIGRLVYELVDKGGIQPGEIAILTGKSTQNSIVGSRGSFGRFPVSNQRTAEMPLFESIARFKGLESSIVILTELEDSIDGSRDESLYVGLSRARSCLFVVGSSDVLQYLRRTDERRSRIGVDSEYMRRLLGKG
jgi:hypothetical protein